MDVRPADGTERAGPAGGERPRGKERPPRFARRGSSRGGRGGAAGGRRVDAYVARTQCSRPPSRRSRWNFTCASSASRIVRPCRTFTTNSCSYGTTCRRPATTQYAPGRQGPPASDPIARRPPNRRRRAECATREGGEWVADAAKSLPYIEPALLFCASDTFCHECRALAAVKIKCSVGKTIDERDAVPLNVSLWYHKASPLAPARRSPDQPARVRPPRRLLARRFTSPSSRRVPSPTASRVFSSAPSPSRPPLAIRRENETRPDANRAPTGSQNHPFERRATSPRSPLRSSRGGSG